MEENNNEVIDLESLSTDRYERQKRISWWHQEILKNARVLVVGTGTVGNEICKNLSLIGVGEIWIIDNDTVEIANLNRSVLMRGEDIGRDKVDAVAEHIKELNPEINAVPVNANAVWDIGAGFYRNFDVVFSGLDNREARIYVNKYCYMTKTPFIDSGIEALRGRVMVIKPPDSSCYECTFSEKDYMLLSIKYSCPGLPIEELIEGKVPMVATTSSVIAGIQVQEAIELLHDRKSSLEGRELYFNGDLNEISINTIKKRDGCMGHFYIDEFIKVPITVKNTLKELKKEIKNKINIKDFVVMHDREIAYQAICKNCSSRKEILKPVGRITEKEAYCEKCGERFSFETSSELKHDNLTLKEHHVPPMHILTVQNNDEIYYVELSDKMEDMVSFYIREIL